MWQRTRHWYWGGRHPLRQPVVCDPGLEVRAVCGELPKARHLRRESTEMAALVLCLQALPSGRRVHGERTEARRAATEATMLDG